MDSDGNGHISHAEGVVVANALGCRAETFWTLLSKYDADGDDKISRSEFAAALRGRVLTAFFPGQGEMSLQVELMQAIECLGVGGGSGGGGGGGSKRSCPTCGHSWLDKYGKLECPKCLSPLGGGGTTKRAPGEASTHKASASSAMESASGECPKGGQHTWKFGKCSKCGRGEGADAKAPAGECAKG